MAFDFRETLDHLLRNAETIPDFAFFSVMFAGSFLEYVFPPVPGDLWTAGGAILISRGQKFLTVFLGVSLGSLAGFLVDYAFGRWLANPERRFRHWGPRWERMGRGIDRIATGFDRHPELYLMVNRFLPGIRALFFVAAGFGRVPVWKVVTFGLLSSIAWNLLLIAAGAAVGRKLDALIGWVANYTWAAWCILGVIAIVLLVRFLIRRRKTAKEEAIRDQH
jgi:membrane protein DedA with SNARE-associated domain